MRKKKIFSVSLALILAAAVLTSFLSLTVSAAQDGEAPAVLDDQPANDAGDPITNVDPNDPLDHGQGQDQGQDENPLDPILNEPTEPEAAPTEPADDGGEGGNGYNEVIEDDNSKYTEPEHLGELPTVSAQDVPEATAVVLPDVEVSDATLFSGIIMWLCVAVGIAVVVGVMVSKRTHRRGV